MPRKVSEVVQSINELVSQLGLEKLAAEDPGTSHPAEKTDANANTMTATEGARSAENSADVKKEVPGQSIDEAKPADASKEGVPDLTTATMTGEDPKVENGYKANTEDPGTSHPASADNKSEKYSSEQLKKIASEVLAEAVEIEKRTITSAKEASEKLAAALKLVNEKATVDQTIGEYVQGYAKSASLVGELTADYLDGLATAMLSKKAEGEPMPVGAEGGSIEDLLGSVPPEAAMAGAVAPEEMGAGVDEEAAALAEAAVQIAQELGVSPEEVLEAALAEAEAGGGEAAPAEMPAEAPVEEAVAAEPAAVEEVADEKMAAILDKAAKYDALVAAQEEEERAKAADARMESVVRRVIESFATAKDQAAGK